jgi:hypothetical protein
MAGYRAAQANFTKGVISPEAEARFELDVYKAAVRWAVNVKVQRTGGLKKRMGTRFVAEALSSSSSLIPFQFSDEQAYALEMAQAKMRPFALGGVVLEDGLKVLGITKAANAVVNVNYHGYSVGDPVYFSLQQGMVEINDRFLTVTAVPDQHHFAVNFDSTNAGTWVSPDTGINRSGAPAAPPSPPTVPSPATAPTPPPVGTGSAGSYDGGGTDASDGGTPYYRGGFGTGVTRQVP